MVNTPVARDADNPFGGAAPTYSIDGFIELLSSLPFAKMMSKGQLSDLGMFLLLQETHRQRHDRLAAADFDALSLEDQTARVVSKVADALLTGSNLNPVIVNLVHGLKTLQVEAPGLTQTAQEQVQELRKRAQLQQAKQLQQARQDFYTRAIATGLLSDATVGDVAELFTRAYDEFKSQGEDTTLPGFRQFDQIAERALAQAVAARNAPPERLPAVTGAPPALLPGLRAQEARRQPTIGELAGFGEQAPEETPQQQVIRTLQAEEGRRTAAEQAQQAEIQTQQQAELASRGELAGQPAEEAAALQAQAGPKVLATEAEFQNVGREVARDVLPQLAPQHGMAFANWLNSQAARDQFRSDALADVQAAGAAGISRMARLAPGDFGDWLRTRGVDLFVQRQRQAQAAQQPSPQPRPSPIRPALIQVT